MIGHKAAKSIRQLINSSRHRRKGPTVSVLVKTYNHARYIDKTIESILDQSFQDFEIIVTDDGSTDNTREVLGRFKDPRIKIEALETNRGVSVAMNETIARANGRYLAILNSDDWALPDRLSRQVEFLDRHPDKGLLFGMPQVVDEAGASIADDHVYSPLFNAPLKFSDYSRRSWLRRFFFEGNCLCAPTAMIRREVFDSVGLYDPRFINLQDLEVWTRILVAGFEIHWLPERFSAFRIRDGNMNASAPRRDSMLRSAFEMSWILKHFTRLDAEDFEKFFGDEATRSSNLEDPVAQRVAELALELPWPPYQSFALNTYHEIAKDPRQLRRLAGLTGGTDFWNLWKADEL